MPHLAAFQFTTLDWAVVAAYFVLTTVLGARLAGRPATVRDFFLGGRRLPWYAVAGSCIATEISAVTFVSLPAVVYRPGGDFTYLQIGLIGSFLARLIIAYVLVPAYYAREIYSPYDYMGSRLGRGVRTATTALFTLGGILGQAARVYLTALVLELVMPGPLARLEQATGFDSLVWSIWIIGAVAVTWTLLGGITTVIWTDVILFAVFLIGGLTALAVVVVNLDGGAAQAVAHAADAGKFRLLDWDPSPTREFTVWTAAIATTWWHVGVFGTDQLMAQRLLCCRDARDARRAVIASQASVLVSALMMLVGVALFAYYREHPLQGASAERVAADVDRVFPTFIIEVVRPGLTGLIIAGVFAAAVSSLDSILAALAQTTLALLLPWRRRRVATRGGDPDDPREQRLQVRLGRVLVIGFGVLLCCMAQLAIAIKEGAAYASILDLALAMQTYTVGALLAGFLLAFLPLRCDGFGFLFSAPLSVLYVFAVVWARVQQPWVTWTCAIGGAAVVAAWVAATARRPVESRGLKTLGLATAAALLVYLAQAAYFEVPGAQGVTLESLAWTWNPCIGALVALGLGWFLANPRRPAGVEDDA